MNLQILGVLAFYAGNEGLIGIDEMQPPGLLYQPEPETGMGNGDEVHGPLSNALAVQVGDAVFCDNIVNIAPR